MTKRKLSDLQEHLFAQIERLGDEGLDDDKLEREVKRTKAMVDVAGRVIDVRRLGLATWKAAAQVGQAPDVKKLVSGSGTGED